VRRAGAEAVARQMQAVSTAAQIVMATAGAMMALLFREEAVSREGGVMRDLFWVVLYCIVAVLLGLWIAGYMASPAVVQHFDVTKRRSVQMGAFTQLLLLFVASVRLLCGIYSLAWR
jgi:hypothetical protein